MSSYRQARCPDRPRYAIATDLPWWDFFAILGFTLSISGIAAFPKSRDLRDIFARTPLDRLILETDSPYLAPPPFRGKRNEPAYIAYTARALAPLFGLELEVFAARTTANFDRLFPRAARSAKAA